MKVDHTRKITAFMYGTYAIVAAHSEACMHLGVAGKIVLAKIVGEKYPMAQLVQPSGTLFSFPITMGEAGFYRAHDYDNWMSWYYYSPKANWVRRDIVEAWSVFQAYSAWKRKKNDTAVKAANRLGLCRMPRSYWDLTYNGKVIYQQLDSHRLQSEEKRLSARAEKTT